MEATHDAIRKKNRRGLFRAFGAVFLLTAVFGARGPVVSAQDDSISTPRLNPIQLERKFRDAYFIIKERYIQPVRMSGLMMNGFQAMRKVPGMEGLKYSDLVKPTQRLGNVEDDFQAFRLALQSIRAKVGNRVDPNELVSAMIRGMVGSLRINGEPDPYSTYLEPEKNRELQEILKGEKQSYAGIGIQFEFREGKCRVVAPIPDSPAYRAGIRPGDTILFVDGHRLTSESDAADRISGDPGTRIVLTVERENVPDYLNFEIVREIIVQPELEKILLPGDIGYVRINSFNEHSGKALLENLRYLEGMGMKKCVLDLRRNAGGLLKAAVDVADVFLPRGALVVRTEGRAPDTRKEHRTRRDLPFTRIPLVVLVDEFTASAAEIVTGAIRDNRRGVAVGMTTFGKGTVQEVKQLDDNSALKLTVARYLTPNGTRIDHKGIRPDYIVKMDPAKVLFPTKYTDPSAVDLSELGEDKQMRKALELLGLEFPVLPLTANRNPVVHNR